MRREDALKVTCPKCGAPPLAPCMGKRRARIACHIERHPNAWDGFRGPRKDVRNRRCNTPGRIYFVRAKETNFVKIGWTKRSPREGPRNSRIAAACVHHQFPGVAAMIPERMEPKGLSPEATPIADFYNDAGRHDDAVKGSQMLLEAICRSRGIVTPKPDPIPAPRFRKPKRRGPGRPRNSRKVRRINYHVIRIIEATAAHFRVSMERLVEPDRRWRAVEPRQVAIYLARNRTNASYPDIAWHFGGRDHTTIIYSEREVEKRIAAVDTRTLKALHEINKKLSGRRR